MSSVYFARASAARRMNGSFSAALSVLHWWLPSRDTRANSSPCEGYCTTAERQFSGEETYGHCTRQHAPPDAPRQSAPCLLRVDEGKEEAEKNTLTVPRHTHLSVVACEVVSNEEVVRIPRAFRLARVSPRPAFSCRRRSTARTRSRAGVHQVRRRVPRGGPLHQARDEFREVHHGGEPTGGFVTFAPPRRCVRVATAMAVRLFGATTSPSRTSSVSGEVLLCACIARGTQNLNCFILVIKLYWTLRC